MSSLGVPFDERWVRFDEAVSLMKALLQGGQATGNTALLPYAGWLGPSVGQEPRHTTPTPDRFRADLAYLERQRRVGSGPAAAFPNALATMRTWVTASGSEAEGVTEKVAAVVGRDPEQLRGRVCVGSAQTCVELLSRYAEAGCQRVQSGPWKRKRVNRNPR